MEDAELLAEVKKRLGITDEFHDDLLMAYIVDVKDFALSSGVHKLVLDDARSVGMIARGVADLWNFGAGDGKFSDMYFQRLIQLTLIGGDSTHEVIGCQCPTMVPATEEEIKECTECIN